MPQRDPVMVYWPSAFLEDWGAKAKKPNFIFKAGPSSVFEALFVV